MIERASLTRPLQATCSFVVGVIFASMAALPAAAQTSEAGTLVKIARREHYRR